MYPHRIRLRGPWECVPLAVADVERGRSGRTVTLPLRASAFLPSSGVRFVRRFGYPGRIDTCEHVWLMLAGLVGGARVVLNGAALGSGLDGDCEFDVTALLAVRNRLEVVLDAEMGALGDVALEVRRDAFLRSVAARREPDGTVRLTGQVVGATDRPLELYVLAAGTTVHYSLVAARAEGAPFDVVLGAGNSPDPLRVELVSVAEVWFAAEAAVHGA